MQKAKWNVTASKSKPKKKAQLIVVKKTTSSKVKKEPVLSEEDQLMKKIMTTPISDEEYSNAIEIVCKLHDLKTTSWYAMVEAQDLVWDQRRIECGLEAILSDTLSKPKIIERRPIQPSVPDIQLTHPIALVCEWQVSPTEWKSKVVTVLKTIGEYKRMISTMCGKETESTKNDFSNAMEGLQEDADDLFDKLFDENQNQNRKETIVFNQRITDGVKKIISEYNSLHPQWSFIRVGPDMTINDKIDIPFIRNKGRAINAIDINLKETKDNMKNGIRSMSGNFKSGYIPSMIMDFVGNVLPQEIVSVVFSKTVAVNKQLFYKGYRLRILTSIPTSHCLSECREYIKNNFVENHDENDLSRCVVNISIPKDDQF